MLLLKPPSKICGVPVDTNYMTWIEGVGRVLQSRDLHQHEKSVLIVQNILGDIHVDGYSMDDCVTGVVGFYCCGAEDRGLEPPKEDLYHWEKDSQAIWGDFKVYAGIDLDRVKSMHWYKFKSIFDSLPPHSQIKRLIQVRSEDPAEYNGKGMEKARHQMRQRKLAAAVWPDIDDDEYDFVTEGGL